MLDRPVTVDGGATLSGRAPGHTAVVLQERRDGGWRDVRTVGVRHDRYRTHVERRGGTQPRKAGGSYWSCTFVDDFTGSTLNRSKWVPQTVFSTGDALSG